MHQELVAALVIALVALLRLSFKLTTALVRYPRRKFGITEPFVPSRLPSDSWAYEPLDPQQNREKAERYHVLDVFRGLSLILMVFVNYGGGGFAIFTHSIWNGLTIADLVFPWLAWILGFSVFLSSVNHHSTSRLGALGRISRRSIELFVLGLFVNNGDNWSEWRIPGVLQALSAAYGVVATADWFFNTSKLSQHQVLMWHFMTTVLPLVLINLLLTFALHVPGCPTGYIGPGGLADNGAYRNCTGGAHLYVDTLVFGLDHIFQTPTCQKHYRSGPYDPEGLMNWMMVATTACFGYLQAALLFGIQKPFHTPTDEAKKCQIRLLLASGSSAALLSIVSGGLGVFPHGPWIPLNKNLWSLSYVLWSSGLASWLLALLIKLTSGGELVKWLIASCTSMGKNSIFIYVMVRTNMSSTDVILMQHALYIQHEVCRSCAPFAAKPWSAENSVTQFELLLCNLVGVLTYEMSVGDGELWLCLKILLSRVAFI